MVWLSCLINKYLPTYLTLPLAGKQEYKGFCITVMIMVLDWPERERQQALGRQDSGDSTGCVLQSDCGEELTEESVGKFSLDSMALDIIMRSLSSSNLAGLGLYYGHMLLSLLKKKLFTM